MKFSHSWIQSYFKKPLPKPDKLAEILTMHSFETEACLLDRQANGDILEIDVLPNRGPDCYSHLGIARECAAVLDYQLKEPVFEYKGSDLDTKDYVSVDVQEPELCPRYIAFLVRDVKVAESPEWLKKRLTSIGQKPINNIVDIGNYVMLETGQPLHAFDLQKIGGRKIVVRKAVHGEKMFTLDNKEIDLPLGVLVIADDKEPMAVAGVKGGKKSGISKGTKDIVVEAAIFNPSAIYQSSRSAGVKTDASLRFEHGVSLFLAETGIKRMAALIQELGVGEPAGKFIDVCSAKHSLASVGFTSRDVKKLLGVEIDGAEITKILKKLRFGVEEKGEQFIVNPPKWRMDINIKEDVIEEIARMYGYENIPLEIPVQTGVLPERNDEYFFSAMIRGLLAEAGFSEVYNYSFLEKGEEKLKLENPVSSEKAYLRTGLYEGLKRNIEANFKNYDTVKLFEIGKVFGGGLAHENERIKIGIAAGYLKDNEKKRQVSMELKGIADMLCTKMGITEPLESEIIKDNVCEVDLSEIIEKAKSNIDLSDITQPISEALEYRPFSKYPAIIRDISLFVPLDTRIEEVMDVIENTGGEFLVDTDLFDEYTPDTKKSLAFRLIFQSFEKTLTDGEVNEIMEKIMNALEANLQWEVRK